MQAKENILETIHHTPLLKLPSALLAPNCADIYAKIEYFNPAGSIKDRICLSMIDGAIKTGKLNMQDIQNPPIVVEATSGNTGLGLAMVCAAKKIKLIIVMPENYSLERRYLLKAYGAELVLTSAQGEMPEAIAKAEEILAKTKNCFMPSQFSNPDNPKIHETCTAQEIIDDLPGTVIDAFVAGVGTAGTFTGVGKVFRKKFPNIHLVAVEPAKSAVLSGSAGGVHFIQGIGAGFIPKNYDANLANEIITVPDDAALTIVKEISKKAGVLVGPSSGANYWAALQVAQKLGAGKTVVTVFPDKGERYFSLTSVSAKKPS